MNFPSDYPTGKSPRRELQLQGPRPAPLKIHKDSHKIKKPPVVPQHHQQLGHHLQQQQPQQPRQPVIIYTVSPKIIHTNPSDFMNLVQRLTGLPQSSNDNRTNNNGGASSTIDHDHKAAARSPPHHHQHSHQEIIMDEMDDDDGVHDHGHGHGQLHRHHAEQRGLFPGILSPGPASLPPINPSNFFSPPSDSFFHDLSPVLHGNRNFIEGSFMPSPSNFFSSPTPSIDLFNNFPDL